MQLNFGSDDVLSFEQRGKIGLIKLQRPKVLNALTNAMIKSIRSALNAWKTDNSIAAILIEGEGRAFCAGGDVVEAYHLGLGGNPDFTMFYDEYTLNSEIAAYPKPFISLLDGIVMGGGAGLSIHGSHRIVTEKTMFAMPEAAIGFFTDVGASHFLTELDGHFGLYLGLTGNIIKWGDCLQGGLATHALKSDAIKEFRRELFESNDINQFFAMWGYLGEHPDFETTTDDRLLINECFSHDSLNACLDALQRRSDENQFAANCLDILAKRSPMSLAVIFEQLKRAKSLSFREKMQMEYRIACHMLTQNDFYEGVRVALIDKNGVPVWQPASLNDVTPDMVEAYFQPRVDGGLDI